MYWNSNPATSLHFEELLNKKDVTLQEIMDDEGVLQECKSQNKHLIEYLIRSDILEKLVSLTTEEPPGDEDDVVKYKYPNIACELLACEVPQLSESLARDKNLLKKLYSFLDSDAPLNPLLASFFSKTLSVLITRNSEQNWYSYQYTCLKVLEFLKLEENSISLLLKHLGTSAIMDLVFKLINNVEGTEMKVNMLNWLDEQKLVENVVALLDPSVDSGVHFNAAQLLCDVIRTSRSNKLLAPEPNKILDRIESPEVVSLLLEVILREPKCETSIVGGISVLLTLLEDTCSSNDPYAYEKSTTDTTDYLKVVASTTKAILPRLKDFHDILLNPPLKPAVKTTITVLEPPLGNTRVEVAKLLSVLVASNNEEINRELAELDTINVLLDLFFKYTWNNFLHTQVFKCLLFALNADVSAGEVRKNGLIAHILSKCHLIQRILDAWQDNETQQTEHKRPRRGYMGHLIQIANKIIDSSESHSFGALMKETVDNETLTKWENFAATELAEIHETYFMDWGDAHSSSNKKDIDNGKEGSFGAFSQKLYSNYYQLHALAPAFTRGFRSFQENHFNDVDDEEVLDSSTSSNFQKLNFKMNEDDTDQQAVFFEKVCAQKLQTLDDYNGFVWNQDSVSGKESEDGLGDFDGFGRSVEGVSSKGNDVERDWQGFESSSSDEEDIETNVSMQKDNAQLDFNALPEWPECSDVPPAESLNPWESSNANPASSPDLGWANFDSAPFFPDFGPATPTTPTDLRSTIATAAPELPDGPPPPSDDSKLKKEDWEEICKLQSILESIDFNEIADNMVTEKGGDHCLEKEAEKTEESENIVRRESSIEKEEKKEEKEEKEKEKEKQEKVTENVTEKDEEREEEKGPKGGEPDRTEVNSVVDREITGDVNSVVKINEQNESSGNFRFPSSQGLMTNSEKEPGSGDSYQLLKENVQAVPNETAQTSNKEVGNNSPEDKSANGPI